MYMSENRSKAYLMALLLNNISKFIYISGQSMIDILKDKDNECNSKDEHDRNCETIQVISAGMQLLNAMVPYYLMPIMYGNNFHEDMNKYSKLLDSPDIQKNLKMMTKVKSEIIYNNLSKVVAEVQKNEKIKNTISELKSAIKHAIAMADTTLFAMNPPVHMKLVQVYDVVMFIVDTLINNLRETTRSGEWTNLLEIHKSISDSIKKETDIKYGGSGRESAAYEDYYPFYVKQIEMLYREYNRHLIGNIERRIRSSIRKTQKKRRDTKAH